MKKLLLVDGHSLIHRAYHAYPKTLATAKGELTNAVYGFTNILLTAINELVPTHVAVAFDLPKPTFREQMFVGYKQSRVKPDDDMIVQIPRIKDMVAGLNIPIYEVAGFEADDVIGTLAKQAEKIYKGPALPKQGRALSNTNQVIILTSDRDLMQLIRDDQVVVQLPAKGKIPAKTFNEPDFLSAWGFPPRLLPDYKALAGDQSDDIPGVKGVGEKTAKELVKELGSIENIYKYLTSQPINRLTDKPTNLKPKTDNRKPITDSIAVKLAEGYDMAVTSKKLATIDTDVPIKLDWRQMEIHRYDKQKVLDLFDELQFKSLVKKLPNDSFEQSVQDTLF